MRMVKTWMGEGRREDKHKVPKMAEFKDTDWDTLVGWEELHGGGWMWIVLMGVCG